MESLDVAVCASRKFVELGVSIETAAALAGIPASTTRMILGGTQQNNQKALVLFSLSKELEDLQKRTLPIPINFKRIAEVRNLLALAEADSLKVIVEQKVEGNV